MKIILMRHGEASFRAPHDDLRELTEDGRRKIVFNVEKKRDELASIALFLSSPIKRARQTADLVRQTLKYPGVIEEVDWLVHESTPAKAIQALEALSAASVMLFSHQPFASRLVESLCGLPPGEVAMNTASVVAMEVDPVAAGCGRILWQLN